MVPDTSLFPGRRWLRIGITSTGLHRLDGARIQAAAGAFPLDAIPADSLRLFVWPGIPTLPEGNACEACDYREVALGVVDNGGNFSSADQIYFWALGPSDWADFYDAGADTTFWNSPYETHNYYWLTWGTPQQPVGGVPKRIAVASGDTTGAGLIAQDFPARAHFEQDHEYFPNPFRPGLFWEKWYWQSITNGRTYRFVGQTPGALTGQPSLLTARFFGTSSTSHSLDVSFNGLSLGNRLFSLLNNEDYLVSVTLHDGNDTLTASVGNTFSGDQVALAWWEVRYRRRFQPVQNQLFFDSPGQSPVTVYHLEPFTVTSRPQILDLTDPLAPIEVTGGVWDTIPGFSSFHFLHFEANEPAPRRYWVGPASSAAFVDPTQLKSFLPAPNLRSSTNGADYLVIYYDAEYNSSAGFDEAANLLLQHRGDYLYVPGKDAPYETMKVRVSDIYNQFSGGRVDPGAIRNFLHAAVRGSWRNPPAYVMLLGDGSYDYKNINGFAAPGQPPVFVATYENGYEAGLRRQYESDDWLFDVDPDVNSLPDVYGGRLPVADPAGAAQLVREKIIPYDTDPDRSEWKNRILLIADDFIKVGEIDCIPHLDQTVEVDEFYLPHHFDRDRVYMYRYPLAEGGSKPAAQADTKKKINEGVLAMNYIGHGSPFKLADETVLLNTDAETFTNKRRPNLFVAASCDVGKFSDPLVPSLGERMLLHGGGGSIAVVSATEQAFSGSNVRLAEDLYEALFKTAADEPGYPNPIGRALVLAKYRTISSNSRKYVLLGDPGTVLSAPRLWIDLRLEDAQGTPLTEVGRGQTVVVRGAVREWKGGPLRPMNGLASVLVEDATPYDTLFIPECSDLLIYPFTASPMFRGDVVISGGEFTSRFVAAGDARLGARGRVRVYAHGPMAGASPDSDAVGDTTMAVVRGTLPSGDEEGPLITLSFPGGATQVRGDAVLRVDLSDPSGILITDRNLANSIYVTVDGNTTTRADITSTFHYANNSYQQGSAFFTLPNLPAGDHEITVSAADNLAVGVQAARHRSRASISFRVTENPELRIVRSFVFPNPVRRATLAFLLVDVQGGPVNCLARIYTVSGRLVRTLKAFGAIGQLQIPWDGLDDEQQPLGNGIYFYRVQVNGQDANGQSNPRQKAVAEGKIAVVAE